MRQPRQALRLADPRRRRWRLAAGGAVAAGGVLAACLLWRSGPSAGDGAATGLALRPPVAARAAAPVSARPDLFDRAAASAAARGERSVEAIRQALYEQGSLRQSQPDGGWSLDGQGALRPAIGVRRRFDQLLTTLGEASAEELGRLLRQQATTDIGAAGADQVMRLWEAYVGLQRQAFHSNADPADPTGWQAALDERVQARRAALGPAWADAFYREDEAAAREHIAARQGGPAGGMVGSGSAEGTGSAGSTVAALQQLPASARRPEAGDDLAGLQQRRVAEFGVEAARRLAEEDASQQRWDDRIAQARDQIARWQQAPELSPAQRAEAVDRYVDTEFVEPGERLRARGLLKLEPPR